MYPSKIQQDHYPVLVLLLAHLAACVTTAAGPTAYISIAAAAPYSTLKPCAANCLVYNGDFACGVNRGYYDLGIELACSCSPQNFCFCDPNSGASASAYISSCVNKGCGPEFPGEVTSAMNLYDGYCATANVAAAVQTTAPKVSTTTSIGPASAGAPAGNVSSTNLDANANQPLPTSTLGTTETSAPKATSATNEKKGLAQSDVIALAVGLGVGLPSLLLALATFCLQRKRREREHRVTTEIHYVK